jgi:FMN phosphatase YigB (HAD superfamily)
MNLRQAFRGTTRERYRTGCGLLTLDVFDTCLIRDFVSQESLWYLIGHEAAKQFSCTLSAAEFVRLRGDAEAEARVRGSGEDIALIDVYARMGANLGWTPEQQRLALALEEDLEMRGLRLNPRADALLAKAQGVPVAYLTDTPHRGSFIRVCLDMYSLPAGDVLSSGDIGLRKGTGSLFRAASKRFNVGRDQMLHIGNDLRSDAVGSARAGVPFASFAEANPTRYEMTLDGATTQSESLLGAVLAGRGREFRLTKVGKRPPALVSIASGVAGPTVFAAVAWTLLSAQRDGIGTLYFVARDGELLLTVAKLLQRELSIATEIDCRYLYGSRRSWHLPALSLVPSPDVDAALRRLLVQTGKGTLRDLLSHLDLSVDEAAAVMTEELADFPVAAPLGDRLAEVIDVLASSPTLQSLALARAKMAYEATVAYLHQEGMFSGAPAGLVDIGWHGAASASLVAIAATQGAHVLCYFAGGLCGQRSAVAPQDSRAFLIDARGEEPGLRKALVHLMESFCAGSGGSTLGYMETGGRWHPRLAPQETNRAVSWGLLDFQDLVSQYVAEACRGLVQLGMTITLDELEAIRPALKANLSALWYSPTYPEAEAWGSFPFEDDQGSPMLGRAVTLGDVARYIRHFRDAEKRPRFGPWGQAVIARTIGGRHFADPFASLRIVSSPRQRLMVRAAVRSKLAFRPAIRIGDIDVREGELPHIGVTRPGTEQRIREPGLPESCYTGRGGYLRRRR